MKYLGTTESHGIMNVRSLIGISEGTRQTISERLAFVQPSPGSKDKGTRPLTRVKYAL
jgi:hypothetical protein